MIIDKNVPWITHLGNLMLLCEIDPAAIYQWFMELFVDAYDWAMVPDLGRPVLSLH